MKKLMFSASVIPILLCADTNETSSALAVDAGADFRVRQEIMHNVPGLPGLGGASGAFVPRSYRKNVNHLRFRPRLWARAGYENFGIYGRVVDEFREHVVRNGTRRKDRAYNFPDELALDSLYFEGRDLFDGFMDFRIGRQDLFDGRHSTLGLDRIMLDGAPYVGSRSCYADMARFTFKFEEDSKLDAFALYDNGRNTFSWGDRQSRGRPMNAIHPADSPEMDEWGGGLVWSSRVTPELGSFALPLPYKFYSIHKHTEAYTSGGTHRRMPDKDITTFGIDVEPQLTEFLSLEFDAAKQFGVLSDGNKQAGGHMGYAAIDFHPNISSHFDPFARLSGYYLSGDRHRTGANDNDTAWDPMWARAPCDSEMFQYGTLYGLGYWENIIYTKLTIGADFGPLHRVSAYSGPMWAAEQDNLGTVDGDGSRYKGFLSAVRYDFPILLAPKGARGLDRFSIFGHVIAELFNPGDYYDTSRPAWFVRWELMFKF